MHNALRVLRFLRLLSPTRATVLALTVVDEEQEDNLLQYLIIGNFSSDLRRQ